MKKKDLQILIVDDDASFRTSLGEAVKKFGYKPTVAGKVDEAISLSKIRPFHLAIIDCMLPKMNGIDLIVALRKTPFSDSPAILMSGIFKDKSFSNEAVKKTRAIEFLIKPFELADLKAIMDKALDHLSSDVEVPLNTLISFSDFSKREKLKSLETIEEIVGSDLPFIVATLMGGEFNGFVNLASPDGNLYGLSFSKGNLFKVDSPNSIDTVRNLVQKKGFVSSADLEELGAKGKKGDLLQNLVEASYISPHALPEVQKEQMFEDLKKLFAEPSLKLNVVPERSKVTIEGLDIDQMGPLFLSATEKIEPDYLKQFYDIWAQCPMRRSEHVAQDHFLYSYPIMKSTPIAGVIEEGKSIDEVLKEGKFSQAAFFKALHLLVLYRGIIFDDVSIAKNIEAYGKKIQKIATDIASKNAMEIFKYFGSSEEVKPKEVERIYHDFAKSNHPDTLPPATSAEVRDTVTKVFSLVSSAHDTLIDETKRKAFFDSLKNKEVEKQMRAEGIVDEALNHLRKGRVGVALPKLQEAYGLHPTPSHLIYVCWAEIKACGSKLNKAKEMEINRKLDSIPSESRRSPYYQMVLGLVKKAQGDLEGAYSHFDRALALDPDFLDVRREMSSLNSAKKGAGHRGGAMDILTGDITQTLSSIFKKKVD